MNTVNFEGVFFPAAMLKSVLIWMVILNLAGCQPPISTAHAQNGSARVPRQQADMINAGVCSTICRNDQTMLPKCQKEVINEEGLQILPIEEMVSAPSLLCHTDASLTVQWSSNPRISSSSSITYFVELLSEYHPSTPASLVVLNSSFVFNDTEEPDINFVTFGNLNETSKYYVRLTIYNCTGQLGDSMITEEMWTLPHFNYTLGPPINMTMEDVIYNNGTYEGFLKWWPAEDRSCKYYLFITIPGGRDRDMELEVPRDMYKTKINNMEYKQNHTFRLYSKSANRSEESLPSLYSYVPKSCLETHENLSICAPDKPENISVLDNRSSDADESEDLYDIFVRWAEPTYQPNYYVLSVGNVYGMNLITKNVTGEKTSDSLTKVNLESLHEYYVSIQAISPGGESNVVVTGKEIEKTLPVKKNNLTLLWAILGPIGSLISIIAISVFVYHRHQKLKLYKKRCRYFEELEQKAPKEAESAANFVLPPEDDAFEVIPEKLILYEVLGEGAFGVVRKGWLPDCNREVAVKMLKDEPSAEEVKQFKQEIDMMKSVGSHPHIVSLVGCCTRPTSTMLLVVEFCARGDLQNYLRWTWDIMTSRPNGKPIIQSDMILNESTENENSNDQIKYAELLSNENSDCNESPILSQPNLIVNRLYDLQPSIKDNEEEKSIELTAIDLLSFGRQIAMGMEFLSQNRVVHRDLAARNVLVCSDKTVKIADFGLSRDIYRENMYKKTGSGKLPIKWMALESLTHQVYTTQSDVWSFGILLWEIVTLGGNPYPSITSGRLLKLLQSGYRLDCPANCSEDLYDLMMSCWQTRPKDRPNFTDIRIRLDKLLDGMCSHEYLSLEVVDYKEINEARIVATDQLSNGSENYQSEPKTDSERYVRPITIGRKPALLSARLNHYISQPSYPNPLHTILPLRLDYFSTNFKHQSNNRPNTQVIHNNSFVVKDSKIALDNEGCNGGIQHLKHNSMSY